MAGVITSFAIGPGCIAWFVIAEIFPAYAIDAAMALGVALNWWANWVVAFAFPLLNRMLGPYSPALRRLHRRLWPLHLLERAGDEAQDGVGDARRIPSLFSLVIGGRGSESRVDREGAGSASVSGPLCGMGGVAACVAAAVRLFPASRPRSTADLAVTTSCGECDTTLLEPPNPRSCDRM